MTIKAHLEALSDQDFLADLIDDDELARILHVQKQSIPVMRCRGKIPIKTYKRGRKTLSSRADAVALVRASFREYQA
jgi:hypothetical protein